MRSFVLRLLLLAACLGTRPLPAAEADVNKNTSGGATESAETAMRRFRVAPGLKLDLFAAEPLVGNIVSFAFDEQGRCYVVESFRRRTSVFDIRNFSEWLDTDFSFRTETDRADFLRRTFPAPNERYALPGITPKKNPLKDLNKDGAVDWRDLTVESERIRLLVDTNSDGRADVAATLAEGFDGITSGVAAGIIARRGEVRFTCIPDVWRISNDELRRTKGMPRLDTPANPHVRHSSFAMSNFLSGFGVHIAFGGHDLHGLKFGPDGKLYFSIADRGTSTNLWDKIADHWPGLTMEALADSGAIFRCEPDGTQLEVVAIGLRNPQELAFDEFGNLFTGDNNGDGGDKARWIHVVEGADYGWRIGWQWLPKMGAWNSEMLWGMAGTNTSAYYLPPVAHIGAGPSGVAYYPGTGLSARYDRHFFMCDFRGGPNSVVRAFALRPKGAGFEAYDESEFLTGPLCTDVDFGTDGAVYVSDWVKGWEKTDKGRIWRVSDPSTVNDPAVLEVKRLLSEGMAKRPSEELARLLGHRDMRVRLEAQWELVAQSPTNEMARALLRQLSETGNGIARIHALWGLGQTSERGTNWAVPHVVDAALGRMALAMTSSDATVRVQALRILGRNSEAANWTKELSSDVSPQVQLSALLAMAKSIPHLPANQRGPFTSNAIPIVRNVLRHNGSDAHLRHAAILALARIGDMPALLRAAKDESPAVRLGVCLALRRLQRPEVAMFLNDSDPQIALEAARAIYDAPIPEALPELAKLPIAPTTKTGGIVARRVLNAHFRLGNDENAKALATFAASDAPEALRTEALELLGLWAKPPGRDTVVGLWRPLPARDGLVALTALNQVLPQLNASAPSTVKEAAKKTLASLTTKGDATVAALSAQELGRLTTTLKGGSVKEQQAALAKLASVNDAGARKLLTTWAEQLAAGQVARELQLDVMEAARTSGVGAAALAKFDAARDARDPLANWRECLTGGDAAEGRRTFIKRQDAACFRCHKIQGEGGEVGPELAGLGQKQPREYLLEAILFPNKTVAPGFESVLVTLKDGRSHAGVVKSESATELVLQTMEDGIPELVKLRPADVKTRDRGLSSMPEELGSMLTKRDVRNLVEFLATLK